MNIRVLTKIFVIFLFIVVPCIFLINLKYGVYQDKVVINFSDLKSDNSLNLVISNSETISQKEEAANFELKKTSKKITDSLNVIPITVDGDDIILNQDGSNINISGQILKRTKNERFNLDSGSYLTFMVYLPKNISKEKIEKVKVTLPQSGHLNLTEKENKFIKSKSSDNPYFNITLEFMENQNIPVIIDWGNGKPITYTFSFSVEVIS